MQNNAFSIINESIEKTKGRLFPFNFREWMKLGLVSMLGTPYSASQGASFNYHNKGNIVGSAVAEGFSQALPLLMPLMIILPLAAAILAVYFSSLFYFIMFDSVNKEKTEIRKSYEKVKHQAMSLFNFRIWIGISILLLIGLAMLAIYLLLSYSDIMGLMISILLLSIPLFLAIFAIALIALFADNVLVPYSYIKRMKIGKSWNNLKPLVRKNWAEILLYLFMVSVIDVVIVSAEAVIGLIILLPFFFLLLALLILAPIIGILLSIIFVSIVCYILSVLALPLSVFKINYMALFISNFK